MAELGKLDIIRLGMIPRIQRDQIYDFWTNPSEVISKNTHFSYLRTSRWRCAETLHGTSGHACDDMYQVWSEYDKALRRYSLTSVFASTTYNSFVSFSKTV